MNEQIKKPNTYISEFKKSAIRLALESDQANGHLETQTHQGTDLAY
jgi:hypothetical protein